MLQRVAVGRWSLEAYRAVVPERILHELREQALALAGARILHINATPYGGGVSELLRSSVPLLRDLGLEVDWKVITGRDDFFRATKALHNGLQGASEAPTEDEKAAWLDCARENVESIDGGYDFIVVHDPQPAALASSAQRGRRPLGVALSHRHIRAEPGDVGVPAAVPRRLRRGGVHDARVRPARPARRARTHDPAGDRPAQPEELRAGERHRPSDPRLDRRHHAGAARHAGVALRRAGRTRSA